MTRSLRELGEDRLLAQILPQLKRNSRVVVGAGDDCAVVKFRGAKEWLLLKSDCVVEGIHFVTGSNARAVGWKSQRRSFRHRKIGWLDSPAAFKFCRPD